MKAIAVHPRTPNSADRGRLEELLTRPMRPLDDYDRVLREPADDRGAIEAHVEFASSNGRKA